MGNQVVSIITTVRNGERFLHQMLLSVYNQTDKDYEHIIVDDGSTDSSIQIVKNFIDEFESSRVILIISGGVGRAAAINMGVERAKGSLIAILDADDIWHPRKIEIQKSFFDKPDVDVVATGTIVFSDEKDLAFDIIDNVNLTEITTKSLLKSNKLLHSSVMMRKHLCKYDITRKSQIDYELWLRLIFKRSKLYIINPFLTFHRIHEDQAFEGKMGKVYRWRSYKLKMRYSLKALDLSAVAYNTVKLCFDFSVPRGLRLKLRKYINV